MLVEFLNNSQRDPRLNEILYPYFTPQRAQIIINLYETNKDFAMKGIFKVILRFVCCCIFGSIYFLALFQLIEMLIMSGTSLNLSDNRIRKSDCVNQP